MNGNLEQLLKKVEPQCPSKRLSKAVRAELEHVPTALPATPWMFRRFSAVLLLATAACAMLFLSADSLRFLRPSAPSQQEPIVEPQRATETFVSTASEIVYSGENRKPVRTIHYEGVRTLEFRNNQTGTIWTVSYPWQQSAVVPIPLL